MNLITRKVAISTTYALQAGAFFLPCFHTLESSSRRLLSGDFSDTALVLAARFKNHALLH